MKSLLVPAVAAALLVASPAALAQRFSDPATPEAPAAKPEAKPADDANNHRVGDSIGFKLPLSLYDEKADAAKDISRARDRAKKDNRRVLVMWGENRCEFCAYLNQLLNTDPRIRQLVETEYEWVKVDIGKFDKNIDLAKSYDTPIDQQGFGAPALTVVEPASNQGIGRVGGNDMVNKPMQPPNLVFNPDFVYNFLDKNKPQPKVANMLMLEAQQRAKRDSKRVLAYFNVYGSDACKTFDKAMNMPEAATALDKAFIIRKIDVERNIAGADMLRRLKGSATATPPWMTILDADGKPVPEAGKGVEYEIEKTADAVGWLVATSGGKLDGADAAAITKALETAAKPPAPKVEAERNDGSADPAAAEAKK